ncbi:MAG: hypothetical protein U0132_02625 [Gemmatimonadaceae bacterium]
MSHSLNQALLGIVMASFGVISYRVFRRLRSQGNVDREVDATMDVPVHDLERPIAKTREHLAFGSASAATANGSQGAKGDRPR